MNFTNHLKMFSTGLLLMLLAVELWPAQAQAVNDAHNSGPAASQSQSEANALNNLGGKHQTDLFTGSFGYSIPIEGAPARNGTQPSLALVYSSGGENGWCGVGWNLDIGFIERDTKNGSPVKYGTTLPLSPLTQYDDTKGFVVNLFGKQVKLKLVSGSEYRAEVDTDFSRFVFNTTLHRWEMYDKSGNVYYFGQVATSRVTNPKTGWSGDSAIFRWALDEIRTATGDQTTISYTTTGTERMIYPNQIAYNGHVSRNGYSAALAPTHTIAFVNQVADRTDKRVSYRWGFRVEYNKRLSEIVCKVATQKVRRYVLDYGTTYSTATKRSLLKGVKVYGSDDVTLLPTQTFDYQGNATPVSFGNAVKWSQLYLTPPGNNLSERCLIGVGSSGETFQDIIDIDGDGLPDRVRWNDKTFGTADGYFVQRNLGLQSDGPGLFATGSGFDFGPTSSSGTVTANQIVPQGAFWSALNAPRVRMVDINGDGKLDRVIDDSTVFRQPGTLTYDHFEVQTNLGNGFSVPSSWPVEMQLPLAYWFSAIDYVEPGSQRAAWARLMDINGDGIPDRVMTKKDAATRDSYIVGLGTGNGFEMNGSATIAKKFGPFTSQGVAIGTLNWFGVGSDYVSMTDINGDGLVDRVMLPKGTNPSFPSSPVQGSGLTKFVVEFNNGYSFETGVDWLNVNPQAATALDTLYSYVQNFPRVGLFDINGDGLPDRVMPKDTDVNKTTWLVQLNNGTGFETAIEVANINIQKLPTNANNTRENWFGIQGVGTAGDPYLGQTITAMMDINGDGLIDRVLADYPSVNGTTGNPWIWVQLNNGPFPDLLKTANNGIGGTTTITYKPSTSWDNREDPANANSGKLLPFPIQTVATVAENDGANAARTTTYQYAGGFYDGSRREFAGFAKVVVADPSSRSNVYFFHQGGGQERTTSGEYQDIVAGVGNFAKKGMAYLVQTYGNDATPTLYKEVYNQVNQSSLGTGRYFPFVSTMLVYDYPGGGTPFITGTTFNYDANGNLTKKSLYGKVTVSSLSTYTFTDTDTTDTQFHHIIYATIAGNTDIKDHPDTIKLTSDTAGSTVLQEKKYTYNAPSGTILTGQTRICAGTYAVVTHDTYDTFGLSTRTTDAVGVQTTTAFDSTYHIYPVTTRARIAANTDSAGDHITTATYDVRSSLLTAATDPMGINVQNAYDVFFRLTQTDKGITPGGAANALWVKKFTYNLGGITSGTSANYVRVRVQDGVDATDGLDTWTYADGFGRPIETKAESEVAGQYRAVNTAYDERGEAFLTTWPRIETGSGFTKPISPNPQPATFTGYDTAGRVSQTQQRVQATFNATTGAFASKTDSAGDVGTSPLAAKTWAYKNGTDPWWKIYTDEDGKIRRYQLDAFGRNKVIEEVDGGSTYTTTLKYDLAGNLIEIINSILPVANADHIYQAYDDDGNLVAMADPHLGQWTYKRDAAGRIREQTDGKGQKVVFTYGATLSRLNTKQVYNAAGALVSTATYSYDSGEASYPVYKGQLFQVTDSEGWEKNGYDFRGRLAKTTRHLNINNQDYTSTYTYNDGDKVSTTVYPNSGPTITYAYHPSGALKTVSRPGYNFYTTPAGSTGFDEFGHVLQFTYDNGIVNNRSYYTTSKRLQTITAGSILTKTYQYSAADDVKNISGTGMSATAITYDNLHRVTAYGGVSTYSYDAVGNINVNPEPGGTTAAYGYGTARKQAVKSAHGKTYLYDKCGNMIVRRGGTTGSQALDYDAENHLTRFSQAGTVIVEYGYAANGQRLWKRTNQDPTKLNVWIGNIYEEKDGKTLFHVFAGGQRICTFEPTSVLNGGANPSTTHVGYYYHQDNLGSSSVLSGNTGSQLEINVYYPFGRTQTATPQATFKVSNQFTGQVKDEETGLYYYGARYYDPELGRFIQPDTVIPDLSNPQSYNRYAYVLNNPLKYVDPDGHSPREVLESVGNFAGGTLYGVANVLNFVPVQIRGEGPPPSSTAEYYGRRAGEAVGVGISLYEIYGGGSMAAMGSTVVGAGVLATAGSSGAASPVTVPAMVAGGVVVVGGAVVTTHGVIGVNNFMSIHTQKPSNKTKTFEKFDDGKTKLVPNEGKHHPNSVSPTPKDQEELFRNALRDPRPTKKGQGWAIDKDGTIHRFSGPSNGTTHWNGSTATPDRPITRDEIDNGILKTLEKKK